MRTVFFTVILLGSVIAIAAQAPAAKDDPGAPIFEKGVDQMTAKQYDQAILSFRAYSKVEPEDPAAYLNTGLAYYNLKKYDLALAELKTAVKMKPDYARAWRYIGGSYFNLKRYPD